ncbi:MAG: hypothetical protein ACR2MS_02265 [Weeksellaceae bacterium]
MSRNDWDLRLKTLFEKPRIIFHEEAGVISPDDCWVMLWGPFMYIGDTLPGLAFEVIVGFAKTYNIVG